MRDKLWNVASISTASLHDRALVVVILIAEHDRTIVVGQK